MFRATLSAGLALVLSACMPSAGVVSPGSIPANASTVEKAAEAAARADAAVDRAWTAYVTIREVAELVVPFISPARAAQVRAIEANVEAAFARARATADLAAKAAELAAAAQAAARLEELTVDPD